MENPGPWGGAQSRGVRGRQHSGNCCEKLGAGWTGLGEQEDGADGAVFHPLGVPVWRLRLSDGVFSPGYW